MDSSIETGRIGATEALTLGKEGLNETPVTPLLPPVRPTRPIRSSSRSGKVVPSTLFPRNSRNMNHFPMSDTSDSAYSESLVKHSLPPYLGQPCSFVFTVDNDEVIFKGKFVNPATHSDLLVAGKATLRTPFCVLFSDECKRYSTTQANKAVKLSHKIYLIAAIIAHVSIHDMLGLDSLAPLPQVHASFKETIKTVHPDKNNGVNVCGVSQATQKLNDAFNVYKDAHDTEADNARPINQRPRAAAPSASSSRSIGQGQAAPDGSSPAAASGPAPQPQSHGPA